MSKNYSVARVVNHTRAEAGKFERHIERKNEYYANMNIDSERTQYNICFKKSDGTYNEQAERMLRSGEISLRGLKPDAKIYDELIFDVNTDYFEEHGGYPYAKQFFEEAFHFAEKEYGNSYVLSAVMHADEVNLAVSDNYNRVIYHYHLHVMELPVIDKEVKWSKRCKDNALVGTVKEVVHQVSYSKKWKSTQAIDESGVPKVNAKGKPVLIPSYSLLQDRFFEHMRDAGFSDFQRGERGSTDENLTVLEYQIQQDKKRLEAIQANIDEAQQQMENIQPVEMELDKVAAIGKKSFTGKIQMPSKDYEKLSELAKEGITSRKKIVNLENNIAGMRSRIHQLENKLYALTEQCRPYLEALQKAPERISDFIK